jgi:hypothetical protein
LKDLTHLDFAQALFIRSLDGMTIEELVNALVSIYYLHIWHLHVTEDWLARQSDEVIESYERMIEKHNESQ